jgi:outer membrane protein assembly factor BamB
VTKHLRSLAIGAITTGLGAGLLAAGGLGCGNKNVVPPKAAVAPVPAGSFSVVWRAELAPQKDALTKLYVRPDHVYAYSRNRVAYTVNRASGALTFITEVNTTGGVLRAPVVLGSRVVFPTASSLEVYDNAGKFQRSVPVPYPTRSAGTGLEVSGGGGLVIIGLDYPRGGRAAAVNIDRPHGNVVWELLTFGGVSAKPALFDNVLYIGSEDGRVYAVGPDRQAHWSLDGGVYVTQGRIVADLHADASGVYVASTDSKLYCIDRATGKTNWQYFGGGALTDDPQVTEDSVYLHVPGHGVVALDKGQGQFNRQERWAAKDALQFLAADATNVYLRRRDNSIVAVDKATGKPRFASKTNAYDVFGSNTLTNDGTIYAADKAGTVVAIRPG